MTQSIIKNLKEADVSRRTILRGSLARRCWIIANGLLVILCTFSMAYAEQAVMEKSNQYFREIDDKIEARYLDFEANFIQLTQTVDSSLELRISAKALFNALDKKLKSDDPIRADEQRTLLRKFAQYRDNRNKLNEIVKGYKAYGDESRILKLSIDTPSVIELNPGYLGTEKEISINPEDDLGRLIILEIKMWIAAKLIIIDNYTVAILRYRNSADSRRQFDPDHIDPKIGEFIDQTTDELLEDDQYERIAKIISFVQKILTYEIDNPDSALVKDKDNTYLNELIERSYAFYRIPQLDLTDEINYQNNEFLNLFFDAIIWVGNDITYQASKFFGYSIGLFETRQGKMKNLPPEIQDEITGKLQPLDILLEKTPFRLTDSFIPGHWGHVAIWVGDKTAIPELKRLGIWDKLPEIESEARIIRGYEGPSFQDLIKQNRGILEALRSGVELNTFQHFLNIDDLAVIRAGNLKDSQKKTYLLNAFKQIGKAYDFNFDVETHKEIVCSELAFVVYDDFDWPVKKSVGRFTVSPDHIAMLTLGNNAPIKPILIYHDGRKLPSEFLLKNLEALLFENYSAIVTTSEENKK